MEFDIQRAFDSLHQRFDTMEANVREVRDQGIENRTNMEALVGNGQPGKIQHMEDSIKLLNSWKDKSTGYLAALSAGISALGLAAHFVWDLMKGAKH